MLKLKTVMQQVMGNRLLAVEQQCPHFTRNKTDHKRRYLHKGGPLQNTAQSLAKITVSDGPRGAEVDGAFYLLIFNFLRLRI